jgi:hypothetical protein
MRLRESLRTFRTDPPSIKKAGYIYELGLIDLARIDKQRAEVARF